MKQDCTLRPIQTRIPEHLRKRLADTAKQNNRSMNAEIISRLQESFVRRSNDELIFIAAQRGAMAAMEEISEMIVKWAGEK